ncbi:MAG TPA: hypothetical protein VGI91_03695 [Steroidobacteraceae bacterium]
MHLHRNEAAAAIRDLSAAIVLNPDDALAYHLRAEAHQALNDAKAAAADASSASRLNPAGWPGVHR